MKKYFLVFLLVLSWMAWTYCDSGPAGDNVTEQEMDPFYVAQRIQRGINVGNTLEPPLEGAWNNGPMQEYYFDDIKAAGFQVVRIPVRWDQHTDSVPPYTIDEQWMERVEQVVDWALSRDLYVILNAHHEWWLVQQYDRQKKERFLAIWTQIADHFAGKSPGLLFEVINEPKGLTREQCDSINHEVLRIIRNKNPHRIVIMSGNEWANAEQLVQMQVPDDGYIMGYYHSYDPWSFAGEGQGVWGSEEDIQALISRFALVSSWSQSRGIPVMLSEFGAVRRCEYNSRMRYYFHVVRQALIHGIPFMVWDDGGDFAIYDRKSRVWSEVKDILIHTYRDSPSDFYLTLTVIPSVRLSWKNNRNDYSKIRIERKTGDGNFVLIAELAGDKQTYEDGTISRGQNYIYRIVATVTGQPERHTYPIWISVP